ncbi:MAG: aspartate kinase [Pseudomonadales bacterium]
MHTVEKVGGTSMSRVDEVLDNVFLSNGTDAPYGRIFVVSAYGGVTDMLLEHKHSGDPGVYALVNEGENDTLWEQALTRVGEHLRRINHDIFPAGRQRAAADAFVAERIEGARTCLMDLQRLCSFGHFRMDEHLDTVREMLASIGEAHSAHNTVLLLKQRGVKARLIDLTGWKELQALPLDRYIASKFEGVDIQRELPVVTGYAKCEEGLMRSYDRGYSELTFSRIATLTNAAEAIIHKEYHLSSADPRIVGTDNAVPIGRTNYDVADQLAILGMEAIHPGAAQGLRRSGIPLRVRNSFEPDHAGTLIDAAYMSEQPRVEIIAGQRSVFALEVFNHDMLDHPGHALKIQRTVDRYKVRTIQRESNANTISYYLATTSKNIKRMQRDLEEAFPAAQISLRKVALISAIGSNLSVAGLLSDCVSALSAADINILAMQQPLRSVDMRFIVAESEYEPAITALHQRVVERRPVQSIARSRVA